MYSLLSFRVVAIKYTTADLVIEQFLIVIPTVESPTQCQRHYNFQKDRPWFFVDLLTKASLAKLPITR